MANLRETPEWVDGIYQFETDDPVMGGENGIDNRPTRELACRTLYLKQQLEQTRATLGGKVSDLSHNILPVGAIIALPKSITNLEGFLKLDGGKFNETVYPDLFAAQNYNNRLPNINRVSDVGMTAYFPANDVPDGWIAFDTIGQAVTAESYPELYQYLVKQYGSVSNVPKVDDRFIRNIGKGNLTMGQTQDDTIRNIKGRFRVDDQIVGALEDTGAFVASIGSEGRAYDASSSHNTRTQALMTFDASRVVPTDNEIRPKSIAFLLCIKAVDALSDIVFWIKAYGAVSNLSDGLDIFRVVQDVQDLRKMMAVYGKKSAQTAVQLKTVIDVTKSDAARNSLTHHGWYAINHTLANQSVKKLGMIVAESGKLTVAKARGVGTSGFAVVEKQVLQVTASDDVQWFDVGLTTFKPDEFLVVCEPNVDTAKFKYGVANVKGFTFYKPETQEWAQSDSGLNIGVMIEQSVQAQNLSFAYTVSQATSGASVSNTNVGWFYINDKTGLLNKVIKQVGFVIAHSGKLTVAKARGVGTSGFAVVEKQVLQVTASDDVQWFDVVFTVFKPDEFLVVCEPNVDTAKFKYGVGDAYGGFGFYSPASGGTWSSSSRALNIGCKVESGDGITAEMEEIITGKFLHGKKISFIGDSITTFGGHIVTGNAPYYPRYDITQVSQTWWKQFAYKTGALIATNDAWSGSRVSNTGSGSLQTRLNKIAIDTDICLLFMGTNDLGNRVPLGNFNKDTAAYNLLEFSDAYCHALENLIKNYPTTKFVALTPIKRFSGNTHYTNSGQDVDMFCNRIIEICQFFGVEYIDMRQLGITKFNHTAYLADGLHPNAKGADLIADFLYRKLFNVID